MIVAIFIAAVVMLLILVYQHFCGRVPPAPHPTLVSPTSSIQASQQESPVPKPNTDQETLSEETKDEAGPILREDHGDTTGPAAELNTDEDSQQQQTTDSQILKEISPTHASLEMDALPLQPRGRVVVEEESLPVAASTVSALPPVPRENDQAGQQFNSRNQDSTSSATETAPKQYLSQDPNPQDNETAPKQYLSQDPNPQDNETTPKQYLSQDQNPQDNETTPKQYLRQDPNQQDQETTPKQYQDPSQHMAELKHPANVGEEESCTESKTMSPDTDPSEPEVIYEQRRLICQETTVKSNLTYARDELLQGALLATSEVSALSPIPRENYPASQPYRNRDAISPDPETAPRQHLSRGHERRVNLPTQRSSVRLQEPPSNWSFDDLLTDLNNMISTDELNILKDKFKNCLLKKAIGEIKAPRDLFEQMKQRNFLNANDIIYLQAILRKLGRQDLIERTIDYCLEAGNVLYFNPATGTPENGYKYVKFHLYLDKEYSKDDLTELQRRVAKILGCPSEYVHVPAVEPSESLLVTIMLPEMYVNILIKYLDKNLLHDQFAALGIDTITIDEKVYEIEVCHEPGARRSDEQLLSLYHQLSNRDLQIEGMDNTCDQLRKTIQELKAQEEAKTAQLAEKHNQLMAKVEMLENKVESEAALIEESEITSKQLLETDDNEMLEKKVESNASLISHSEKKCKQLEQKMENLERQGASSNALLLKNQTECKELEKRIESLEKWTIELNTLNTELDQENTALKYNKDVLLQHANSLKQETDRRNKMIYERNEPLRAFHNNIILLQLHNMNLKRESEYEYDKFDS